MDVTLPGLHSSCLGHCLAPRPANFCKKTFSLLQPHPGRARSSSPCTEYRVPRSVSGGVNLLCRARLDSNPALHIWAWSPGLRSAGGANSRHTVRQTAALGTRTLKHVVREGEAEGPWVLSWRQGVLTSFPKRAEMQAGQEASYAISAPKEKSNGGWRGRWSVPKEILASVPNARGTCTAMWGVGKGRTTQEVGPRQATWARWDYSGEAGGLCLSGICIKYQEFWARYGIFPEAVASRQWAPTQI